VTVLAVIDSQEAAARARADGADILATDNPLLAAAAAVENIDRLVPQPQAFALGKLALAIAHEIDRKLANPALVARYSLLEDSIYTAGVLSRTIASLLHRGATLARALEKFSATRVAVFAVDVPPFAPAQPFAISRFSHPARTLAERGFFGEKPVAIHAVEAALPGTVNDTATSDPVRRIALFSPGVIAHEALRRVMPAPRSGVVVAEENETIRETLPWLGLKGVRARARGALVRPPKAALAAAAVRGCPVDPVVASSLEDAVRAQLNGGDVFDAAQADAVARLVLEHVSAGLEYLARQIKEIDERLSRWFGARGGVLLTNGLFGPAGAQAYGLCRRRGIQVVEFEHGVTAGISALTDLKLAEGQVPTGDLILVVSNNAARAFAANRKRDTPVPVGLPDCVRGMRHATLQRRLARKALNIGPRHFCIMHVSALLYAGNLRPGLGTPSESTTYEIDRTLIEDVYASLPHRVVFKQYPTQRFPYEPGYQEMFRLAPNVSVTKEEDFRYIRAAADVIVTVTPTSTLGWCVGTGKPLVWLDSGIINPLSRDDLRDAFCQAFLFVSLDDSDWPEQLKALLQRDPATIAADWRKRAPAREALLRNVIAGPEHAGRRAADLIVDLMRRNDLAAAGSYGRRISA
jgi:hypothetical protein